MESIAAIWKSESARVVGALTRIVRDVGLAEDCAQEALIAAMEEWPRTGMPERPGAWLMTTAKNRALNLLRHEKVKSRLEADESTKSIEAELERGMDEDIADDVLRLAFIACHPVLSQEGRVALTLRLLGGLSTAEIARAYLTSEPTIAQRIVRAKRTLEEAHVPFELPKDLGDRLGSVLEVVYLIFNEGYSSVREELARDALRLGQVLADFAPDESEARGLLALMQFQASRMPARLDADGEIVLLENQDRSLWDRELIARGKANLAGAKTGPYVLQARIAECHADGTDWAKIASLYGELQRLRPSPVIELNRAVAISRAEGPVAGLAILDRLAKDPALAKYHWLPSARADLLEKLGRLDEAKKEFARAAELCDDPRQKKRLLARGSR